MANVGVMMAGIDHKTAKVEIREKFSLSKEKVAEVIVQMKEKELIDGCVLLSTCNRTELYLSYSGEPLSNPIIILCNALGYSAEEYEPYFIQRSEHAARMHLMMVSAGLRSQIRGEDQIITQVVEAAKIAREMKTSDAILETLFRNAITAGKKSRTDVALPAMERSVAGYGIKMLKDQLGELSGKKILVIGNGIMGRLAADHLVAEGCEVTITLRSYRHGVTVVPNGCKTISYNDRYDFLAECDVLLSATASPHYTILKKELEQCEKLPNYFLDLAMPRDIEPSVEKLPGITCWNVDDFVTADQKVNKEKIKEIVEILREYEQRFCNWYDFRCKLQKEQSSLKE